MITLVQLVKTSFLLQKCRLPNEKEKHLGLLFAWAWKSIPSVLDLQTRTWKIVSADIVKDM
jgi:hypothetical protein